MSRIDADRNLLFGILALQMDFIDQGALIAAMSAWVLAKDRSIGEILVERGALGPAEREALEAMIRCRMAKHDDDPARSLAAISSAGAIVADLQQAITDPDVHASIALMTTDPHATRVPETGEYLAGSGEASAPHASHARPAPDTVDYTHTPATVRYRKVRDHARGGLGIVYVALDGELNREVALKEIKPEYADNLSSQARFLLEAEITGGLEHPGIVPVYGLGAYDDGRPFYAMRFIKGDSLKHAIADFHADPALKKDPGARALALQKLLRRFLDVCNAVAYAHSRGVLHRDLKPDNVMVGRYGETLVVDWGLAKAVGRSGSDDDGQLPESALVDPSSGSAETLPGSVIGTPGFMSPEQAAGRLDLLGPASDVYSLGATLYNLLTGQVPFRGREVVDILRKVERGEFSRPRESAPWLAPALEAITLKAMALRPDNRYPSPKALADDIESWLADEPVTAHREPWPARAARWARQHKTAVVGAASLLITAVVALGISTVLLGKEQERTESQRRRARDAADGFLARITDDPQLARDEYKPLRGRLLEAGVSYYEDFAREGIDPRDKARLAEAYARVGRINELVGSRDKALASYRTAIDSYEEIRRERPDDPIAGHRLIEALFELGKIELDAGRMPESRRSLERALALAEEIQGARRDDESLRDLAMAQLKLGEWCQKAFNRAEAEAFHRKALDAFEKLAKANPGSARTRFDLARSLADHGAVLVELMRPDGEALAELERARTLHEGLLGEGHDRDQQWKRLVELDEFLAALFRRGRKFADALAAWRRAGAAREVVLADNSVLNYLEGLAKDSIEIASIDRLMADLPGAVEASGKARELAERVLRISPGKANAMFLLAKSHEELAKVGVASRKAAEARQAFEKAAEILEKLVDVGADQDATRLYRLYLATVRDSIGNLRLAGPDVIGPDDALRSYEQARKLRLALVAEKPEDSQLLNSLGNSHNNIGSYWQDAGRKDLALDEFRKCLAIRTRVIEAHPDDLNARSTLAIADFNLSLALGKDNQPPAALAAMKEAVKHQRIFAEATAGDPAARKRLAEWLEKLAALQREQGQAEDAAATSAERRGLMPEPPAPH